MTILQVAGEDESWGILNGGVDVGVNTRRTAYTRCSIHSANEDGVQIIFGQDLKPYLDAQPAGDKDFWFSYRFAGGGGFITGGIGLKLYDSTDKLFMMLRGPGASSLALQTSTLGTFNGTGGDTWGNYGASETTQLAPAGNPFEYSFRIKIHPTLGHIAWYINGTFWFQTPVGDTTGLCTGSPKFLRFGCPNSNSNSNYSEFIATSADDPAVGKTLATLAPDGDGLTGWAGGYISINEIVKNTSTQVTTGVTATDVSFSVTNIPALSGATIVRALIVSGEYSTAAVSGVPQHVNQFLRFSGVIYPGALRSVAAVIGLLQTIWSVSPVTSTTITEAETNAVEIGMRSAA
jgi:hypothetical protein